jgi:hypothetical protein
MKHSHKVLIQSTDKSAFIILRVWKSYSLILKYYVEI